MNVNSTKTMRPSPVQLRLIAWGNWCKQIARMGLGYGSQSALSKLIEQGTVVNPGTAKVLYPSNKEAEQIDDLLDEMAKEGHQLWGTIINIQYTMDSDSQAKIAQSKVSRRTYYKYLAMGEDWLSQYLNPRKVVRRATRHQINQQEANH